MNFFLISNRNIHKSAKRNLGTQEVKLLYELKAIYNVFGETAEVL